MVLRLPGCTWRMPPVPVPVRGSYCVGTGALSSISIQDDLAPTPVGVKVIVIWQVAPASRVAGQLLVWAKSAGLNCPFNTTRAMVRSPSVVFATVTTWAALVEPTV